MKLHATIAGQTVDVEVRREGEHVSATVDGRSYELDVQRRADSYSYIFLSDGVVSNCRVEGQPKSGQPIDVFVGTKEFAIAIIDPKRLRGAQAAGGHGDEAARIVAPMPGKVVRVLVEKGQVVDAGSGVIVVEAMKMQNEMKSPKQGTVAALNVEVGATVNGGDVLAVIE